MAEVKGTKEQPWVLKTPSGTAEYTMYKDEAHQPPILVCVVGKTVLQYDLRCIQDVYDMLKKHGDWMELGSADEQKPAKEGTVEAWGRSPNNPLGGWYGLKKGLRGRFGMYLPPLTRDAITRDRAISGRAWGSIKEPGHQKACSHAIDRRCLHDAYCERTAYH